ncbi:MAG: tRNA (N6-isopentenyl adenosine(37)-C2)-methylthiotransferase MiaB [Chlamydiales bacterium]
MKTIKDPKTFFIRTYGCQMNENDTEVMAGMLQNRGMSPVTDEDQADLLIFNTCSIRDLAERKVLGKVGKLGRSKRKDAIIGITGCMANNKKSSLFRKLPHIDFVMGTSNIHELNQILDEIVMTGKQSIKTDDHFYQELDYLSAKRSDQIKAYVSIIRGCDKMCTYCIVPYTRGKEVSRSPQDIIQECQHLADQGYREITLLGQNVNSYGKDVPEWNCLFHDLLAKIDALPGIERIRFMTSHPVDITRELMEAIRDLPSLCEFVHFPIQAGSNRILRKMNRRYTKEQYFEKVHKLREIVPNATLGTDIIVGFPTETDEEFEETFEALKEIEYSVAFLFAFSPRKGTPATRWKDDVPEDVKQARLQRLIHLQDEIIRKHRQEMLDSVVEVLVERRCDKNPELLKGRTRCWKKVLFKGDDHLIGTLQNIHIHSFSSQTLLGNLVK